MKKLLLASFVLGCFAQAQAQSAGSILLYGNVGVSASKVKDRNVAPGLDTTSTDKWKSYSFNPGLGFAITDHFTVGVQFGGNFMQYRPQETATMERKVSDLDWHAGIFLRHTMPVGNIFFCYTQLDLSYLAGNHQDNTDFKTAPDVNIKDTYSGVGVNLMPAVGIHVTKCFALNFGFGGLGFNTVKWKFDNLNVPGVSHETTNSNFDFTLGQQFNVGVNLFFNNHPHAKGHHEPMEDTRHMDTSDDETPKKRSSDDDDE